MNTIRLYLARFIMLSSLICPILVYVFPDYFFGILAFQVIVFIVALVNAYYLKKQYEERQKAHNERFGDLSNRMNKLFGEDWGMFK